jgi:predicted RNA-binding protein YlxR (DUF448 family)
MSKPVNATLNGKTIQIFHQSPIKNNKVAWRKAENDIARSSKSLEYGICRWIDESSEREGAKVVKIPEGHSGVMTEIQEEELEAVGTLLKKGRGWYVETDVQIIEILRRQKEVTRMKNKTLFIDEFGNDHIKYSEYLSQKDEKEGKMVTRGHGLS